MNTPAPTPSAPLWRATHRPEWRDNGAAAFLIGGLLLSLGSLVALLLLHNRSDAPIQPNILFALMLTGLVLAGVCIYLRFALKIECTLDGRALHVTVGRKPRPDLDLARIRLADIVDRHDGLCDLLLYLQPGPGGDTSGMVLLPRLPKDNAEAGLDALRLCGVPVAPPLDASAPHAFPAWMTPRDRRLLATRFGRGERLLWAESAPPLAPFLLWIVFLLFFAYATSDTFLDTSIASRLHAAFSSSDWATTATLVGLLALQALQALVLLTIVALPPLVVRANRWQTIRWITTHRLGGVTAPNGVRLILTASCLAEPPVLAPRPRNRADLLVLPCADPAPSLAEVAAAPAPRNRAAAFRNLPLPDATAALAALQTLRSPAP